MNTYHKIQTLFKRNMDLPKNPIVIGDYTCSEYKYLEQNMWLFDEKIDGTNTKIFFNGLDLVFGGKTDDAQMPAKLVKHLQDKFLPQLDKFKELFVKPLDVVDNVEQSIYLYGEGYGGKIQNGGKYRPDESFILYDIKIGNWWLKRKNVKDIAKQLSIDVVPEIGQGTLKDLVERVRAGVPSAFGDFIAEGIVARPAVPLFARNGQRIITKLKHRDFKNL